MEPEHSAQVTWRMLCRRRQMINFSTAHLQILLLLKTPQTPDQRKLPEAVVRMSFFTNLLFVLPSNVPKIIIGVVAAWRHRVLLRQNPFDCALTCSCTQQWDAIYKRQSSMINFISNVCYGRFQD